MSNHGEKELQGMQKRVEKLATDTALGLKKNVYKNYSQFIETAKEISSELYIIRSHLVFILSSSLLLLYAKNYGVIKETVFNIAVNFFFHHFHSP